MILNKKRQPENLIYFGIWILVIVSCVVDMLRTKAWSGDATLDFGTVIHMVLRILPFAVLFVINNAVLIPRLILKGKYLKYLLWVGLVMVLIWCWQINSFIYETTRILDRPAPRPDFGPRPMLPLPVFLDFICDLFVIGVNLAIALVFQRMADKLEQERLMKTDAENQLAYLRAQLNPHFYMNMLNNIHGMIDINPEKAQDMLIDMSQLMRYMLYESSLLWIPLNKELEFLENYLKIMRLRYPDDKVRLTLSVPPLSVASEIVVPPLVFLVFIENAFKHGISYREESFVSIKIELYDQLIQFTCINSVSSIVETTKTGNGIGLKNIMQRLKIIYGESYAVDIRQTKDTYTVNVSLPAYENKDIDNR
ncbi:MAG: histidine kinase [Muribaculaceae bacterium]|nr:histidine kinase [Muribaculaceae bacterium]